MPVCAARSSEMPGSCRSWHVHGTTISVAAIHHKSAPLGRSDQLSCLCGVASIYTTGPSPEVHPTLKHISSTFTVERDCSDITWLTVARRNTRRIMHQTWLGNRCNRWSLRALQRACARSCSTSPSTRYCQLSIMGGAAYPRALSTRDLQGRGVAHGRPTGKPTAEGSEIMMWSGCPASLACSGDRPLNR